MLIEVKVKTKRIIEEKARRKTETYILNKELFAEAEYTIFNLLNEEQNSHLIEEFEIQSIKLSLIKEIASQYTGDHVFVATLKDTWLEDDGTEKYLRYKVLLWANSLTQALERTHELARQGYDMQTESLKEVDYIYLREEENND